MGPWAHGPMGPWAPGVHGPHGPMGPWAMGRGTGGGYPKSLLTPLIRILWGGVPEKSPKCSKGGMGGVRILINAVNKDPCRPMGRPMGPMGPWAHGAHVSASEVSTKFDVFLLKWSHPDTMKGYRALVKAVGTRISRGIRFWHSRGLNPSKSVCLDKNVNNIINTHYKT